MAASDDQQASDSSREPGRESLPAAPRNARLHRLVKRLLYSTFLPAGQLLYRVADLSKVWGYVFVYQNQLHCVSQGQGATLRLANLPGRTFHGKVVYVYPYLDPKNRATKVRLEFENPDLVLKPGMYADILLEPHRLGTGIKIPQKAILQTDERSLVYLSESENKFRAREVTTGGVCR
jgi:multidrug efflux pump subunit AcrA (membrane-fusion protein)